MAVGIRPESIANTGNVYVRWNCEAVPCSYNCVNVVMLLSWCQKGLAWYRRLYFVWPVNSHPLPSRKKSGKVKLLKKREELENGKAKTTFRYAVVFCAYTCTLTCVWLYACVRLLGYACVTFLAPSLRMHPCLFAACI